MKNNGSKGLIFVILGAVMAVITFWLIYCAIEGGGLPGFVYFFLLLSIPLTVNGVAYLFYIFFNAATQDENRAVLPIICGAATLISGIAGLISLINDHSFMFKGFTAQLIWFFITLPIFILTIIHFAVIFVKMFKKVKTSNT